MVRIEYNQHGENTTFPDIPAFPYQVHKREVCRRNAVLHATTEATLRQLAVRQMH